MSAVTNMAGPSGDARPANRAISGRSQASAVSSLMPPSDLAPASAGALSGFELTLPLPPSTNGLFKNIKRGRAKTGEYQDWIDAAGWNIRQIDPTPLRGRYELSILLPATMRGDISNRIKAVEDLLVAHKLTDDDSRCDAVSARRYVRVAAKTCTVIVRPSQISSSAALTGDGGGPRPFPVNPPAGKG